MEDENELERLMRFDEDGKLICQDEFLEKFKTSTLFLPVQFGNVPIDDVEDLKVGDTFAVDGPLTFRINYLSDDDGERAIPLFTSREVMEKHNLKSSLAEITVQELAAMLFEQGTLAMTIVVNPFTQYSLDMSVDDFMEMYSEELDTINFILEFIGKYSTPLPEDTVFYLRDDEDYMKYYSNDGEFINPSPLNVNRRDIGEGDYLNIIEMPEDYKIFDVGELLKDGLFDTIIAPDSHFKLIGEDGKIRKWKCRRQDFYSS